MKKTVSLLLCLLFVAALAVPAVAVEYDGVMEVIGINAYTDDIAIDGVMADGEWGEPVYTTTPKAVLKNQNYAWDYKSVNGMPTNQRVEIYITNNNDALYVACKLIGANYDAGAEDAKAVEDHAHFGFTIAPYKQGTVVPRILYNSKYYEHFAHYVFATVDGEPWSNCYTQGQSVSPLEDENFAMSYNTSSFTYTYECRIPFAYTNVDIGKSLDVVMSFDIGDANGEKGANRYMISKAAEQAYGNMGAGNFAHGKSYPLVFQVHDTAAVRKDEYLPTAEEQAAAQTMTQSGTIAYDAIADTDVSSGILMGAAWIVAAIAGAALLFTAIVLITIKKRS